MLNLLLSLAGIFALIGIVGRLLHRYFIYIPDRTRVAPEEAGLTAIEEIVFKAADGTKLIAWYQSAKGAKPTLLYFTGNSGNVADRAGKIRTIASTATACSCSIIAAMAALRGARARCAMHRTRLALTIVCAGRVSLRSDIVAYGKSLGTAVATRLSLQRDVQALVLEAPFSSTVDVGKLLWKGLPLGIIMVDQYRTIDRIGEVTVPLFMIHGGRDSIIPLYQARRVITQRTSRRASWSCRRLAIMIFRSRRLREGTWLSREPASGQGRQGGPPRGTRCGGERRSPLTATPID